MPSSSVHSKLDESLLLLLQRGFAPDSTFPVVVRSEPSAYSTLVQLVEKSGRIRHSIEQMGAVSAWLPLNALERLASEEIVTWLELAEDTVVA